VAFDPFLYVSLALGLVIGRVVRPRGPWVGRATRVTIVVLVGLLGTLLDGVATGALIVTIPVALGFAGLILGLTAGVYLLLARGRPHEHGPAERPTEHERFPFSGILVGALVAGFALGRFVALPSSLGLTWALYLLLFLVGFDLKLAWGHLERLWVPLAAAVVAALGSAIVVAVVVGSSLTVPLATSLAFGWYTLAGPLVAAKAGTLLGLTAFLTNFFRENLTMILSPYAGRRLRGPGLAALGGATAMDTTLYFVTRYGDEESGGLSLATGLALTLAAGLVLPIVLTLPL
jgi:uncharacterized membrane protein YbjE (DUF340 family)